MQSGLRWQLSCAFAVALVRRFAQCAWSVAAASHLVCAPAHPGPRRCAALACAVCPSAPQGLPQPTRYRGGQQRHTMVTRWSHDTKPCTDGYMVATLQKTTPTKKPHATHLIANYPLSIRYWCLEPESNRHARFHEAADFKSAVSTYFTIQAQGRDWRRGPESNRASRICNPVHNRFVTAPYSQQSKTVPCRA